MGKGGIPPKILRFFPGFCYSNLFHCLNFCIFTIFSSMQEEAGGSVPPIEAGNLSVEAEDGENQR